VIASRPPAVWKDPTNDPDVERRIRQVALPMALLLAFLISRSPLRGISRTFLTMWVHELGHAVAAWLSGFGAFPGPWRTPVSEDRMFIVTLLVAGALGFAGYRAWRAEAYRICAALGVVLLVQLVMTFGVRAHAARAFFSFGGDAGCLVLGTLLMATLYVPPGSALHRGWLRWGFLVIGAFAFMDAFRTWWDAGHSVEGVVFGEIEGVGDSDPTVLVYQHGWSEAKLIRRYMTTAWLCLAALAALYLAGLRRPRDREG
jgi:uncharacterized membrane protein YtjA (UPF0391 family)